MNKAILTHGLTAVIIGHTALVYGWTSPVPTPPTPVPFYTNYASQECVGTCIEACVTVSCDNDDLLLGGGADLDVGVLGNTNAGDNVVLQRNGPKANSTTSWEACGREVQNTPGAGGKNADGTTGGQVPADCSSTPGPCFTNWNSSTSVANGGADPSSTNATGTTWTITAHAICKKLLSYEYKPAPTEVAPTSTECYDTDQSGGACPPPP